MNPIDPRIHQALDGEIAWDTLPPELRRTVKRLEAAAEVLAAAAPAAGLESRVMAVIRRPLPSRARRLVRWLATPHTVLVRIRPAWSLALAAVVAVLALFPLGDRGPMLGEHEGIAQFVGRFPGARSVHVVGSFNDWRTGTIALEDRDQDGVWRGALVLPAGAYEYMFVVDGERWVQDHLAERQVADDFGRENSIVIVRAVRR
jgi:AMP-activated protein kinase-like protein